MVALVIRVQSVGEQIVQTGGPYLLVHGFDMDGVASGPLRLWRAGDGDITQGSIYIIRGLRVVQATYWSDEARAYVPKEDGSKTVEITIRTAFEEVTDVPEISQYF